MNSSSYKILSTKQLPDAVLTAAKRINNCIRCIPFIRVAYRDAEQIKDAFSFVTPSDIFLFTSKHAVAATQSLITGFENDAYGLAGSTEQALALFTRLRVKGRAENATLLCEQLPVISDSTYIFCCGNKRLDIVPAYMAANGLMCKEIICYDTLLTPQKVEPVYDAILFFSPSAVESYFTVNEPLHHQYFYCIGTTTAIAVKKYTSQNVFMADEPSIEGVIATLAQTIGR